MPYVLGELKSTCNPLDKEDVRVLVIRGREIDITTTSTKPTNEKLLMLSTKVVLVENKQNISMSKIWN